MDCHTIFQHCNVEHRGPMLPRFGLLHFFVSQVIAGRIMMTDDVL
jgi:hypothetical protein